MTSVGVVIGRNEGDRLIRCFGSLQDQVKKIYYVDSGSTDGSIEAAKTLGVEVIELDMSQPFTAARARNAGIAIAAMQDSAVTYVQVVDGDCEILPGWIEKGALFLDENPEIAIVVGVTGEREPNRRIWNRLADLEWRQPPGAAKVVAGNALLRLSAINEVAGYRDDLIAGEEPDMCLRLRTAGWNIWRMDEPMALHDLDMTRFSQWWRRAARGGHAFAELATLHWGKPGQFRVRETLRAIFWGVVLPLAAILGALFISPWALVLLLAWPLQVLRMYFLKGYPLFQAFFLVLAKLPEAQGVLEYATNRLRHRKRGLIEYK